MTPEEVAADIDAEKRAPFMQWRKFAIRGLDLVAIALSEGTVYTMEGCAELLGQPVYPPDATAFLRSLKGYEDKMGDFSSFKHHACSSSTFTFVHMSPELCKFTLCDWRIPEKPSDDSTHDIEVLYQEQLRLQREKDPLERAREVCRGRNQKTGQYWAQQMLEKFEAAAKKGEEMRVLATWDRIKPEVPFWINDIFRSKEVYGFIIYKSKEIEQRPVARDCWLEIFEKGFQLQEIAGHRRACDTVYGGYFLGSSMYLHWVPPCPVSGFPPEAAILADREHLRIAARDLELPRVLKNTFLVLTNDCVFPQLDTFDVSARFEPDENGFVFEDPELYQKRTIPTLFIWAYDTTWQPSNPPSVADLAITESHEDCKYSQGQNDVCEAEYQGRVKVDITVLFSWFYYARLMEVDLRDMWKKAQTLPEQIWTCRAGYDPSQPSALI